MNKILNRLLLFILFFISFGYRISAQEINCLDCHVNLVEKSAHDKVIKCSDCHSDILTDDHAEKKAKRVDCKKCHAALQAQMENDVHRKLKHLPEGKAPDCKTCHGTHKIINPSTVANKEKMYCSKCHTKSILLVPYHNLPKQNESCNNCHSNKNHKAELEKSVHRNLSCANCHSYVVNNLQNHQKAPKEGVVADCYLCHNAIAVEHKESIHGISLTEGINEAAQCWNCHGSHEIYPVKDKKSSVYASNLVATCSKCHDNPEFIKKYSLSLNQPGKMYTTSVHGKLVQAGSKNAATCVTCHGKHNIKNRVQPGSTINSLNLPNTCELCHKNIVDEYKQSIHWIAVKKGIRSAPTCNDCHSEHNIQSINTADKRNEVRKIQDNTCLQCHNNILLSQRYGVENNNVSHYEDSYHGMAVKRGDERGQFQKLGSKY